MLISSLCRIRGLRLAKGKRTESYKKEKDTEEVPEKRLVVETAIFTGAGGRMKLERTTRAVVLERQVKFSKRIGGGTTEKYVYSDSEKTHRVLLYRWDDAARAWQEIDFRKLRT